MSRRVALVSAAVTVVSLAVFAWFCATQLPPVLNGEPDFPNYYVGGERVLAGEAVYGPIDLSKTFGIESYHAYPADPPATVVLLAPLSLLPYDTAWIVFASLSTVLLAGVAYGTAREVGWARPIAVAVAAGFLVTSPARWLLFRNHMESILLLLVFLGWRSLRRGKETSAGVWWGIAAALKLFPALLLIGLIAARKWRAAAAGGVVAAGVTVLSVVVVGWDNARAFITDVLPLSRQWYGALGNYSLVSFGTALSGAWLGWWLLGIGGVALVMVYVWKARSADAIYGAGISAALLITPLSWLNYLVLIIPGVSPIISRLNLKEVRERWFALAFASALGLWGPIVLPAELPSVLLSFIPMYALFVLFVLSLRAPEPA